MHTRYSPIRHSHGAEAPIPSDLHVLSLPLAFILSQDQTLHCRNCRPAPARRPSCILRSRYASIYLLLFLLLAALPQRSSAPTPYAQPPVPVESEGKDRAFPGPRQMLPPTFFSPAPRRSAKAPMNLRGSRRGRPENFFRARPPRARETPLFTPPRRGPAGAIRAPFRLKVRKWHPLLKPDPCSGNIRTPTAAAHKSTASPYL